MPSSTALDLGLRCAFPTAAESGPGERPFTGECTAKTTYVIDFVVYHELLHKKHGATWQNGRQAVHTPAFRADERRFAEYAAAENAIKQLAKRFGG